MNTEPKAPKIEFPYPDYPIKVIGDNKHDFKKMVVEIVQIHAPDLDIEQVTVQQSRNANYSSVRLKITATSKEQLENLHQELKATGRVKMVL
jgi:putative lipoic acid-binding regulatory protein